MPTIAVVGEVVADAVLPPDGIVDGAAHLTVHPGGGPANFAVAVSRLGSTARFLRYPLSHYGLDQHFSVVSASLTGGIDVSGLLPESVLLTGIGQATAMALLALAAWTTPSAPGELRIGGWWETFPTACWMLAGGGVGNGGSKTDSGAFSNPSCRNSRGGPWIGTNWKRR